MIGLGGEATSLAATYPDADKFAAAGYEPLLVDNHFHQGRVRQYGKFSFTRVFEAGHAGTSPFLGPPFFNTRQLSVSVEQC